MLRGMDQWLAGYVGSLLRRPRRVSGPRHLIVAVCDHYEPYRGNVDAQTARAYVERWQRDYPEVVAPFHDADGRLPRHTFFYPEEEYDPVCLDALGTLMQRGCGEVEIHLHHRNDTAQGLREKLVRFRDVLHREHGMLGERKATTKDILRRQGHEGQTTSTKKEKGTTESADSIPAPPGLRTSAIESSPSYAFIHGNWALCNSRPDGDWCGVNEELGVLSETGCYADLTFPSAPSPTQPRMVNAIYRAWDRLQGRGHDFGMRVRAGGDLPRRDGGTEENGTTESTEDTEMRGRENLSGRDTARIDSRDVVHREGLLLIQGPLALNFARRKWGVLPRIENAELSGANPPTLDRMRLWARTGIHVVGRAEWIFVKLHTHGCVPRNTDVLLGRAMHRMHSDLQQHFNDGARWQLHYVTAREMTNIILAAEGGHSGNPGHYRDHAITPPPLLR